MLWRLACRAHRKRAIPISVYVSMYIERVTLLAGRFRGGTHRGVCQLGLECFWAGPGWEGLGLCLWDDPKVPQPWVPKYGTGWNGWIHISAQPMYVLYGSIGRYLEYLPPLLYSIPPCTCNAVNAMCVRVCVCVCVCTYISYNKMCARRS